MFKDTKLKKLEYKYLQFSYTYRYIWNTKCDQALKSFSIFEPRARDVTLWYCCLRVGNSFSSLLSVDSFWLTTCVVFFSSFRAGSIFFRRKWPYFRCEPELIKIRFLQAVYSKRRKSNIIFFRHCWNQMYCNLKKYMSYSILNDKHILM